VLRMTPASECRRPLRSATKSSAREQPAKITRSESATKEGRYQIMVLPIQAYIPTKSGG
jgi:hypothetical protein